MSRHFKSRSVSLLVAAVLFMTLVACSAIEPEKTDSDGAAQASEQGLSTDQNIATSQEEYLNQSEVVQDVQAIGMSDDEPSDTPSSQSDAQADTEILVSELGFIKVGVDESVSEVNPPGVHPWCISPGEGWPPPIPERVMGDSPPVPYYLPEGVSLDKEVHDPSGFHVGNVYLGNGGVRIHVSYGTCLSTYVETGLWEITSVGDHWGILIDGAWVGVGPSDKIVWEPGFALTLYFETDEGFVEVRTFDSERTGIGKDELLKIAQSMFDEEGSEPVLKKP